jgi:hypothetical protein
MPLKPSPVWKEAADGSEHLEGAENLRVEEWLEWMQRPSTPEQREREGLTRYSAPPADIGQDEALKLVGQLLDERHYTFLFDETGTVEVRQPDGTYRGICTLLKNRIPKDLLDRVRPAIRSAASSQVAAGNRPDAAGAGKRIRLRPDGSETKITGVPTLKQMSVEDYIRLKYAREGGAGYLEDTTRAGQKLPCRQTAWTAKAPISQLSAMAELADVVAKAWRGSCNWVEHEIQMEKASKTLRDYVLESKGRVLPFTTITCNNKWRTAAHIDSGDLKQGFGALCCLGDFEGCHLVFPRFKLAVKYREGDILLADVANLVHGNTPLLNPDGSVPKLGEEPERLVCVFYYREQMEFCMTPEEEMAAINNWKKGKSSRKKKRKS